MISKFVFHNGDSISVGDLSGGRGYPNIAGDTASPVVIGNNAAVSGSTMVGVRSRAAVYNPPLALTLGTRLLIHSLHIGRNDGPGVLTTGVTPSQFAADVAAFMLEQKNAGFNRRILCTLLPATFSGFNAWRNSVNAIFNGAGWAAANYVDALCDIGSDATMGPDAAASNTALYVDGTHPTATGQANLAAIYVATLNGVT